MASPRKASALVGSALAGGALLMFGPFTPTATASTVCNGGTLTVTTSPIGEMDMPVNGNLSGNLTGCDVQGFQGTFNGNGSCNDVNVNVDADLIWANGDKTHVTGPFHVPGGPTPPGTSNTLQATSGPDAGSNIIVNTGPIDNPPSLVGPCLGATARSITIPFQSVIIG
ncbi:hypothetical protein JMUB6875_28750 [Nocardia sp. JMUB6875]|uniref:hypothetical protein n=1 Tax=Nocardia sp. JMUB6875 TaxID=3158170 RepID=UPI0032E741CE